MKTYISLDIETTGFDATKDQVIEIAAIKFEDDVITDTFNTLVNPRIPIPAIITHITGIKSSDLEGAPTYEEIKEKLSAFLENHPIIGHNISFDINFLNQKGMNITNSQYDTLQLSGMLLPGLASYSLDTLTRTLKIKHEQRHRAYDDAFACYQLLMILKDAIGKLDQPTLSLIIEILDKSTLPFVELFYSAKTANPPTRTKRLTIMPKIEAPHAPLAIAEIDLLSFYDEEGALSKTIENYESRPTQKQMTAKILEAFENSKNLIVEAGTGTGKTMAYLLPAVYWSLKNGKQMIISTYTKTLQEQIIGKDIPLLREALRQIDPALDFNFASLKGRRNYLSQKRLEIFLQKERFDDHEALALVKILIWLKETRDGDLEALSLLNKEYFVLDEICCAEHVCPHDNPSYANGCWLMKARKEAENANILIVNHALLMQNAIAERPLLPEPAGEYLVVDEAHHLERVATDSLTVTLAFNHFLKPFERLARTLNEFQRQPVDLFNQLQQSQQIGESILKADQLIFKVEFFFGLLGVFIEKNMELTQFQYQLNLKPYHFDTAEWIKVTESAKTIIEYGRETVEFLIPALQSNDSENQIIKELYNHIYECQRRLTDLEKVFGTLKKENQIIWLFKTLEGNISLKSAPYSIADAVSSSLFAGKKSVILTSATLRAGPDFSFIRDQLHLDPTFEDMVIPSHFDYPEQVKIIIGNDLPEPNSEGYFLSCTEIIKQIVRRNGGRTMVLFTSKKALTAVYMQIAPQMKAEGINVLAQGVSGSRGKILEHFKDEAGSSVIFGTDSFWEGVDLKGDLLTCVVLQKLPFDPPDDPIIQARSQKYGDSFREYMLPRAILKFKQGFGRLIRSSKDTGTIVILDSRIIGKEYGITFLKSLPEGIKIEYGGKNDIAGLI